MPRQTVRHGVRAAVGGLIRRLAGRLSDVRLSTYMWPVAALLPALGVIICAVLFYSPSFPCSPGSDTTVPPPIDVSDASEGPGRGGASGQGTDPVAEDRRSQAAEVAFETIWGKASARAAMGDFDAAIAQWGTVPARVRDLLAERARAETDALRKRAERIITESMNRARRHDAQGRPEAGLAELDRLAVKYSPLAEGIARLRKTLQDHSDKLRAKRRGQEEKDEERLRQERLAKNLELFRKYRQRCEEIKEEERTRALGTYEKKKDEIGDSSIAV